MSFKTICGAALLACAVAGSAMADQMIMVHDAYARASSPKAKSGAAFMVLMNKGPEDDRLVAAATDRAKRVELHTHKENAEGVMQMLEIEGGIVVPAGGKHVLARGGDHVMLMGLTQGLVQGDMVTLNLTFEKAGDVEITVPVDLTRKPGAHKMHKHGE